MRYILRRWRILILGNVAVLLFLFVIAVGGNKAITVVSERHYVKPDRYIVIDAGHGGIDGGTTSCTGVLESKINLDIALKLEDLLHLLGMHTIMIRTEDVSIYTEGESIASKKVSDLRNRVRIINETNNAVLVSIHQNYFDQQQYSGAQVFYAGTAHSENLAKSMQSIFVKVLNPGSNRQAKKANGMYLLKHINCPGVLIECGFLSNPAEESKLLSDAYQKKICCVIASALSSFLTPNSVT